MKSFTAGANENDVRLSRFVEGVTKDMPRSMMYKAFRNKRMQKWDDMSAERRDICESVLGYFFDIVNWMLIARDTVYPVGRNRN